MTIDIEFSIILPAKNESSNLKTLLPELKSKYPKTEIIVVNDGSTDDTESVAKSAGVTVINHPYSIGNGAAIKSGARFASSDTLVFMDGDGQHSPSDIQKLLEKISEGYYMAVGARNSASQASFARNIGNKIYNFIASIITGNKIEDLTSGFRAVDKNSFTRFLYLLPNGFSYPTTITMAFFRSGYSVAYVPIEAKARKGNSHINLIKDGLKFFMIILKIGSLYSPLKFFTPPSIVIFFLGLTNYAYTYFFKGQFTNMSALLIIVSIIIFMFGLLAEQLTVLTYASSERRRGD